MMQVPGGDDGTRRGGVPAVGHADGAPGREHERTLGPRAGLTILISHADGSTTSLLTYPRNLGAGGVSFLSGVELPRGTRCGMQFVTASGRRVLVPGEVRWSTPVVGRIRRVGMAFDRALDSFNLAQLLH